MAKNPIYEQILNSYVKGNWTSMTVPLTQIDVKGSHRNQARLEAVVFDETVERYMEAMLQGDEFPDLVGYEGPHGFILIDGNQRLEAITRLNTRFAEEGKIFVDRIGMYVVLDKNPMTLEILTRIWNTGSSGKDVPVEDAIAHAKYLIKKYNLTIRDACKIFRLSESRVAASIRLENTWTRMDKLTGKRIANHDLVLRLHDLPDRPLAAATRLLSKGAMTSEMAHNFIRDIKTARHSEDAQMKTIENWAIKPEVISRQNITKGGTIKSPVTTSDRFFRALASVERILDTCDTVEKLQITGPVERKKAGEMITRISNRIMHILNDGPKGDTSSGHNSGNGTSQKPGGSTQTLVSTSGISKN
jgi:hypothetical protein